MQHRGALHGLVMLALPPLHLLPQDPTAALLLVISGSGLEVHPIQATEGSDGGCSLGSLVLVATFDRTREHLVLRKNLILSIFS